METVASHSGPLSINHGLTSEVRFLIGLAYVVCEVPAI